jgi:hypothetical protein
MLRDNILFWASEPDSSLQLEPKDSGAIDMIAPAMNILRL